MIYPFIVLLKYCLLSWIGSTLENGVPESVPKSLTMRSIQNAQQSRNAARSLSRHTTGSQFSNLGVEDIPPSSTSKRLGKSKAHLGVRRKDLFLLVRANYLFFPLNKVSAGHWIILFLFYPTLLSYLHVYSWES
jgi:hypothetical protein